jgi:hypothetical protein
MLSSRYRRATEAEVNQGRLTSGVNDAYLLRRKRFAPKLYLVYILRGKREGQSLRHMTSGLLKEGRLSERDALL